MCDVTSASAHPSSRLSSCDKINNNNNNKKKKKKKKKCEDTQVPQRRRNVDACTQTIIQIGTCAETPSLIWGGRGETLLKNTPPLEEITKLIQVH